MNADRARETNQITGSSDSQLERTRTLEDSTASSRAGSADRAAGTMPERTIGAHGTPTDTQTGNNPNSVGEVASAGHWDRSCFIGKGTDSFAFQTSDGRTLQFDSASNLKIKNQLDSSSRVAAKDKIFRARVTGSAEGQTIHLTNIVM
jgi:hypothetical protein